MRKQSDAVLMAIIREFKKKVDEGMSIARAKDLGGSEEVSERLFPDENPENILDYMNELKRNGYIDAFYADNKIYTARLTDKGIEYGEERFGNQVKNILEKVKMVKDLIPFI